MRDQLEALAIVRAADDAADDIVERLTSVRHHRVDLSALSGLPLLNVCSGDGHEVVAPNLCKASSVGHALARKPAFEQVTDHHQVDGTRARWLRPELGVPRFHGVQRRHFDHAA